MQKTSFSKNKHPVMISESQQIWIEGILLNLIRDHTQIPNTPLICNGKIFFKSFSYSQKRQRRILSNQYGKAKKKNRIM